MLFLKSLHLSKSNANTMKNFIFTLSLITILIGTKSVSAQNNNVEYQIYDLAWEEEKNYVSVGYGFGNFNTAFLTSNFVAQSGYQIQALGPFFAKYEYAFSDLVGFGVNLAYVDNTISSTTYNHVLQNNQTINLVEKINFNSLSLLARMNFHFGANKKIDPYFGMGMGYRTATYSFSDNDPFTVDESFSLGQLFPLGFEMTFGTRLLFTENIGAYVEVGLAKAVFQFGLTSKF